MNVPPRAEDPAHIADFLEGTPLIQRVEFDNPGATRTENTVTALQYAVGRLETAMCETNPSDSLYGISVIWRAEQWTEIERSFMRSVFKYGVLLCQSYSANPQCPQYPPHPLPEVMIFGTLDGKNVCLLVAVLAERERCGLLELLVDKFWQLHAALKSSKVVKAAPDLATWLGAAKSMGYDRKQLVPSVDGALLIYRLQRHRQVLLPNIKTESATEMAATIPYVYTGKTTHPVTRDVWRTLLPHRLITDDELPKNFYLWPTSERKPLSIPQKLHVLNQSYGLGLLLLHVVKLTTERIYLVHPIEILPRVIRRHLLLLTSVKRAETALFTEQVDAAGSERLQDPVELRNKEDVAPNGPVFQISTCKPFNTTEQEDPDDSTSSDEVLEGTCGCRNFARDEQVLAKRRARTKKRKENKQRLFECYKQQRTAEKEQEAKDAKVTLVSDYYNFFFSNFFKKFLHQRFVLQR